MRTPAILASFLLILPALGQQSGYTYSCWGEYLSGTTLNAFCNDSLDREWTTWIDLNICLINGHGTLYCQAGWGFPLLSSRTAKYLMNEMIAATMGVVAKIALCRPMELHWLFRVSLGTFRTIFGSGPRWILVCDPGVSYCCRLVIDDDHRWLCWEYIWWSQCFNQFGSTYPDWKRARSVNATEGDSDKTSKWCKIERGWE